MKSKLLIIPFMVISCLLTQTLCAQENTVKNDTVRRTAIRVFLDCYDCDMNFTRQQIPYINYVRDVKEAQVYILVTDQNTASGGEKFTYTFHGQGDFLGMDDTLSYTTNPDQTRTEIRKKRTDMLKMGLMRYVARTPLFNEIEISHNEELEGEEVIDRWNYWVFELSTEPQFESEEENKELDFRNSLEITRITPDLKLEMELDHFFDREKFIEFAGTDSSETTTYSTSSTSFDNLFVKSIGEHWSAGLKWDLGSSTRENYRFMTKILPSVEYDIFPYSEATHRQLRILYSIGYQFNNYIDTTINYKTEENLFLHSLNIAFQVQKKWGSVNLALAGSNYLNDFSRNRVELNTWINFRIFKGLSLEVYGGVAHINDQFNLKKGKVTEAERLLRLRELQTRYRIEGGIELTYTFGSIYNNVVNPRFSESHFYF